MKPEYEAIIDAGFVLQLDCPDLAMTRHREFAELPLEDFPPLRRASHRSAQCGGRAPAARAHAHPPLLGQLPGAAPSRRPAC
jgi:hypothetical protein